MITIWIRHDDFTTQFVISGHAHYAAPGQDIVCAGVSAITDLLANTAMAWRDHGIKCLVSSEDDDSTAWHIMVSADGNPVINAFLDCVTDEFEQMAEQYPDNVTVTVTE